MNMKFNTISSLTLGAFYFLGIYILNVEAEASVQPHTRKVEQTYTEYSAVKPAAPKLKLVRRARGQSWTAEEEQRLIELREQRIPWDKLTEHFPDRTWKALTSKYQKLTTDPSSKSPAGRKLWTPEEKDLLLELKKTGMSWAEISERFPGRTENAVNRQYRTLVNGTSVPKRYYGSYSAEEDELLLELDEARVPWKDRVKYFDNRSLPSLRSRLDILGSGPRQVRQKYTLEEDELIIQSTNSGKTIAEISRILERSEMGVRHRIDSLRRSNRLPAVQTEKGLHYSVADFETMREMRGRKMTWKEIASEHFPDRSGESLRLAYRRYNQ